ncbi:hypothetical protein NHH03_06760 [Stieleria sp. TO1_6]|nr:hypothetical protein [Stieleria tagensis]
MICNSRRHGCRVESKTDAFDVPIGSEPVQPGAGDSAMKASAGESFQQLQTAKKRDWHGWENDFNFAT